MMNVSEKSKVLPGRWSRPVELAAGSTENQIALAAETNRLGHPGGPGLRSRSGGRAEHLEHLVGTDRPVRRRQRRPLLPRREVAGPSAVVVLLHDTRTRATTTTNGWPRPWSAITCSDSSGSRPSTASNTPTHAPSVPDGPARPSASTTASRRSSACGSPSARPPKIDKRPRSCRRRWTHRTRLDGQGPASRRYRSGSGRCETSGSHQRLVHQVVQPLGVVSRPHSLVT